jgi:DNA polymerase III epsilon subunit-like protein
MHDKHQQEEFDEVKFSLVLDVETTGFMRKNNPCRTVSICWEIVDNSKKCVSTMKNYYIKPDNFTIPQSAINIHGITNEFAHAQGEPIAFVFAMLAKDMNQYKPKTVVAHNISFDMSVILSELTRLQGKGIATMTALKNMKQYCTMHQGKIKLGLAKKPKLCDLYERLLSKKMTNMHDARADTAACRECYLKIEEICDDNLLGTL